MTVQLNKTVAFLLIGIAICFAACSADTKMATNAEIPVLIPISNDCTADSIAMIWRW